MHHLIFRLRSGVDPGFPLEGCQPSSRGCQHMILPSFLKNCMKLRKFWAGGGACAMGTHLGSATVDDLVGINGAWLHKEPKVSVLQASAHLTQKGECWTWNQRLIIGPGSILTGGNILLLEFFHIVKPLMPILVLLPISSSLWKTLFPFSVPTTPKVETPTRLY